MAFCTPINGVRLQTLTWGEALHGVRDSGVGTVLSVPKFAFFGLQGAILYLLSDFPALYIWKSQIPCVSQEFFLELCYHLLS